MSDSRPLNIRLTAEDFAALRRLQAEEHARTGIAPPLGRIVRGLVHRAAMALPAPAKPTPTDSSAEKPS